MFEFLELTSGDSAVETFAYWLLVIKKPLPKKSMSLENLKSLMSRHYDIEEQAYTSRMLKTDKKLLFSYIQPIAPVTLALKWTPFALAKSALGDPIHQENRSGKSAALAIWKPKYLGAWEPEDLAEDHRHFVFLLRIACSAAIACEGQILLFGSPGWSYSHSRKRMINPSTSLLMHKAGYVYTDRIPQ